jgi:N-methylhydantoinase B
MPVYVIGASATAALDPKRPSRGEAADGGASVEGEGHKYRPWGFLGGHDGHPADLVPAPQDGEPRRLPSKVPYTKVRKGDRILAVGPCGGGYGDPLERDPERELADVLDGYFTAEVAERDYGVAIRDQILDRAATEESRAALRAARA